MSERSVMTGVSGGSQWRHWRREIQGETAARRTGGLAIWGYTGKPSYQHGETLALHASSTARRFSVLIYRDGEAQEVVYHRADIPCEWYPTPSDAYAVGCGWPAGLSIEVPSSWRPGAYIIEFTATDDQERATHDGFFLVRPSEHGRQRPIAMILATYTWQAYNDWGGGSAYSRNRPADSGDNREPREALREAGGFSPRLSFERPWARGLIRVPTGAPRLTLKRPPPTGWAPRHEYAEWAFANGYSLWSGCAGWAQYDSLFARWAERAGYPIELLTQWDLDQNPSCLEQYACVVTVGHDEYWTARGRRALDAFITRGGRYARMAGNIFWQMRLEDEGKTQVCYKYVCDRDPLARSAELDQRTGAFGSLAIGNPAVTTFGGNGACGAYSRYGAAAPRGVGGFIVYRNRHWVFANTDLYYADVLGNDVPLVGYEADGVRYSFENGLPVPTGGDGAPDGLQILALTPVTFEEEDHGHPGGVLFTGDKDLSFIAEAFFGADSPENRNKARAGSAVITWMCKGAGEVVCAGSTEWPYALSQRSPMVEQVVRNILDRFGAARERE